MLYAGTLIIGLIVMWFVWAGFINYLVLSLGMASVVLVLYLALRMKVVDEEAVPIKLGPGILTYWAWLLKEIVVANFSVARIVLSPSMPISPSVIKAQALQKGVVGQVIFANSITLTPGTVTMDINKGELTVHALTRDGAAAVLDGDMNRRVAALTDGGNRSGEAK